MKNSSCKAAAIEAANKGKHQINNVGACIAYKNRILSVGWNSGDRTRLKGALGYTSTEDTASACDGCASVHAEVSAWMHLPSGWKRSSTKLCRTTKYCQKGPKVRGHQASTAPLYLHCPEDSSRKVEASETVRELLEAYNCHRSFQVDLLHRQ